MNFSFNDLGILFGFDMVGTIAMGLISLFVGKKLKEKLVFLDRFGIPAAVIGGILFALVHLIMKICHIGSISYDTTLQTPFMVVFFTTIGLGSSIAGLKKGGKLLVIFWILSGIMTFMQTVIGVSLAKVTGINPLLGVMAGSVSMSGGHGSAGAFGQTIEELGVTGGLTVALSAATFGLIAGGLLGSPLAVHLIKKFNLKPKDVVNKEEVQKKDDTEKREITLSSMMSHVSMLSIVMTIGIALSTLLKTKFGIALPSYVGAMFVAIIFNNLNIKFKWLDMDRNLINIIGETSLNIFLSMALISLKLWELAALAIPLLIILFSQVLFMWLYTRFIVFKAMGGDYDAAVMVSGMCGSGLGATTNAMINMGEISGKYGYTVNPYLIVPLTGAFLIDIFQMPVIITAINMFK
ncbi:MAG: sodium/glutamate symporter [Fusobacterium sp.]|uniref:sodium/glutamate symporter n=1 Tax=Fusobacterium sp. TaxID=68766 RepID=UPI002A7659B4|nr:sodium/glutamate symporter [Fusobacterium sp.]MDY2980347.1 sodium/glutamate symporter [Fusobacterium sp.]